MAQQMATAALVNRLKIQSQLEQRPDWRAVPIDRPLFIIGYPRTGTTLLQNLLSLDTHSRTLKMYEALCPVPPESPGDPRRDPRINLAKKFIKMTHYISPQVPIIHSLNPKGPDECLKLLENTFTSPHFLLYFHAPSYWQWLTHEAPESFANVYAYHRRQLQLLSEGKVGVRWVLKAPVHLFFLDALLKAYPDASIVFMHRNPQTAIASFCSLLAVSRAIASDRINLREIGEFATNLYEISYERATRAREAAGNPGQFYDIDYQDLVNDPLGTVRGIYEHFGYTHDPGLEQSIKDWLKHNPQHKHGVHRYSMEKFGLDAQRLTKIARPPAQAPHIPARSL